MRRNGHLNTEEVFRRLFSAKEDSYDCIEWLEVNADPVELIKHAIATYKRYGNTDRLIVAYRLCRNKDVSGVGELIKVMEEGR